LVGLAAAWCFRHGYILYYGDAQCHLNISRSLIDSRTPGYDQLGTVWLPLLHVICLPFAGNDLLWSTGLAGTIPVAICFVIAGTAFYFAAKEAYRSSIAAAVAVVCFALNPNLLYLATIPMTEVVFLAGAAVLLWAAMRFRRTQNPALIVLGVVASWAMSLTRYDGWFLIPFAALWFAWVSTRHRVLVLILFGFAASLAPFYWMAHNWWETSNALDFYNGPYSAAAIQGNRWYPGYHDWILATRYYAAASDLCAGWPLVLLGLCGIVCGFRKKVVAPIAFLFLTPLFYIWSIHSSKTPIHVPSLWPHSYYNTRYGIAVVALAAFASGAIAMYLPSKKFAFAIPVIACLPWIIHPSQENWICWKESEVNSVARRAWTERAAEYLVTHYSAGQGIWVASATGDVSGIFCRARIPLAETLNIGNGPAWLAAVARPDLAHRELFAIGWDDDAVATAIARQKQPVYRERMNIHVKGAPPLKIYKRHDP
jgi:hypothetical protein